MNAELEIGDIEGHDVKIIEKREGAADIHVWDEEDIPFEHVEDDLDTLEAGDVIIREVGHDHLIVERVADVTIEMEWRGGDARVVCESETVLFQPSVERSVWIVPEDALPDE